MERIMLRHVNRATARGRVYFYHRVTRERPPEEPNARALRVLEINEPLAPRTAPDIGSVADLVEHFKSSPAFTSLAPVSRRDYGRIMDRLKAQFGDLPTAGIDRKFVLELRDSLAATPRHADYTIAVLRRLLAFAIDRPSRYGLAAERAPATLAHGFALIAALEAEGLRVERLFPRLVRVNGQPAGHDAGGPPLAA